jgi:hypothetical protein
MTMMTCCRGFGRCAGLGPIEEVCKRPRSGSGLAAPITDGPLGKALRLGKWTPVDALIRGYNITGPLSFSWAHVDASPKLSSKRAGFTLQARAVPYPFQLPGFENLFYNFPL